MAGPLLENLVAVTIAMKTGSLTSTAIRLYQTIFSCHFSETGYELNCSFNSFFVSAGMQRQIYNFSA
ncbi:MAG: hypothetical protein ACYSSO_04135, partial [Planctomycetota bacterium]